MPRKVPASIDTLLGQRTHLPWWRVRKAVRRLSENRRIEITSQKRCFYPREGGFEYLHFKINIQQELEKNAKIESTRSCNQSYTSALTLQLSPSVPLCLCTKLSFLSIMMNTQKTRIMSVTQLHCYFGQSTVHTFYFMSCSDCINQCLWGKPGIQTRGQKMVAWFIRNYS